MTRHVKSVPRGAVSRRIDGPQYSTSQKRHRLFLKALPWCHEGLINPTGSQVSCSANTMSPTEAHPQVLPSLPSALRSTVIARIESLLLNIVRANVNTQYASRSPILADFRDAIFAYDSASDTALVTYFWRCVPLSEYDAYKPFMAAFDKNPCKEAELENLFAPGLPFLLAVSSATSGKAPKLFPKYTFSVPRITFNAQRPAAMIFFGGHNEVKQVGREPGQVVGTIPVSTISAGVTRAMVGYTEIGD